MFFDETFLVVLLLSPSLFSPLRFFWATFLLFIIALLFMILFRHFYTFAVTKIELVLHFSLFLLSSFEKIYWFSLWLCCCSSDLGSVLVSVTVFGDVVKSFSKLSRKTSWISRLSFPYFPVVTYQLFCFWSVIFLLTLCPWSA